MDKPNFFQVMRIIPLFVAGLGLLGCQSTPQKPLEPVDFTVHASKLKTKEAIISTFIQRNYRIVTDSEFQLVLDRPANDNMMAMVLLGSDFNRVPNARVTFTITGDNPTQANARLEVVTNPGSGFERVMDVSNNAEGRAQINRAMEKVKIIAEKR